MTPDQIREREQTYEKLTPESAKLWGELTGNDPTTHDFFWYHGTLIVRKRKSEK